MDVRTFSNALKASQRDKGVVATNAVLASVSFHSCCVTAIENHTLSPWPGPKEAVHGMDLSLVTTQHRSRGPSCACRSAEGVRYTQSARIYPLRALGSIKFPRKAATGS